jgi:hypothetical protein
MTTILREDDAVQCSCDPGAYTGAFTDSHTSQSRASALAPPETGEKDFSSNTLLNIGKMDFLTFRDLHASTLTLARPEIWRAGLIVTFTFYDPRHCNMKTTRH